MRYFQHLFTMALNGIAKTPKYFKSIAVKENVAFWDTAKWEEQKHEFLQKYLQGKSVQMYLKYSRQLNLLIILTKS